MYFFTATILNWQKLLAPDKYKQIILSSLQHLVEERKSFVYGFVIMPNHIHLLWDGSGKFPNDGNEAALLRFTGHQFKKDLTKNHPAVLERFRSTQADREYHFWERRPYTAEIYNREVAEQKLEYMHNNPLQEKWKLTDLPENYPYSSASFYLLNKSNFGFITHYAEHI